MINFLHAEQLNLRINEHYQIFKVTLSANMLCFNKCCQPKVAPNTNSFPDKRKNSDATRPYMSIEEILVAIGEYRLYQILLTLMIFYCVLPNSLLHLSFFFVAYNPGWQCVANSSVCNDTGIIRPADKQYKARCSMSRTEWQYPEPDDFSVVTQVSNSALEFS